MTRVELTIILGIAASAVIVVPLLSQTPSKPSFQVASVKANANSGFSPTSMRIAGNRFSATGMPLRPLIMQFYGLRDFQILGGPGWIDTDQWDFEAVSDDSGILQAVDPENPNRPTPASLMVQSLIENRFQFKFHRDTKELAVYELTVAKNGPKIKVSTDQAPGVRRVGRGEIDVQAVPFASFVYLLARQLDHALIDRTNLKGIYDIKLQWSTELKAGAESSTSSDRPSIFTALQEQLGLKLESTKGPVDVLVIDSAQRPSEN